MNPRWFIKQGYGTIAIAYYQWWSLLDGDYRLLQIVQITEKQVHFLILTNEKLKLMLM